MAIAEVVERGGGWVPTDGSQVATGNIRVGMVLRCQGEKINGRTGRCKRLIAVRGRRSAVSPPSCLISCGTPPRSSCVAGVSLTTFSTRDNGVLAAIGLQVLVSRPDRLVGAADLETRRLTLEERKQEKRKKTSELKNKLLSACLLSKSHRAVRGHAHAATTARPAAGARRWYLRRSRSAAHRCAGRMLVKRKHCAIRLEVVLDGEHVMNGWEALCWSQG